MEDRPRYTPSTTFETFPFPVGLTPNVPAADYDNPLARSMQRTVARRSISRGSFGDLDEALLGDETLVAYAAAAGTTADDGTGRNSPYTAALLEHLEQLRHWRFWRYALSVYVTPRLD